MIKFNSTFRAIAWSVFESASNPSSLTLPPLHAMRHNHHIHPHGATDAMTATIYASPNKSVERTFYYRTRLATLNLAPPSLPKNAAQFHC